MLRFSAWLMNSLWVWQTAAGLKPGNGASLGGVVVWAIEAAAAKTMTTRKEKREAERTSVSLQKPDTCNRLAAAETSLRGLEGLARVPPVGPNQPPSERQYLYFWHNPEII